MTPGGPRRLATVLPLELPMLGSAAPVRLCAPSLVQGDDVRTGPLQRLLIEGSDPEYLLGEARVLAEARWLVDGRRALREQRAAALPCVVLALEAPGLIFGDGAAYEATGP